MEREESRYSEVNQLEENLKKALTEMLLLSLLSRKECYIGELTDMIREKSRNAFNVVFPYGAIYRLQQAEYIRETVKRTAPDGRRRQYFIITETGNVYLKRLKTIYFRVTNAVTKLLEQEDTI